MNSDVQYEVVEVIIQSIEIGGAIAVSDKLNILGVAEYLNFFQPMAESIVRVNGGSLIQLPMGDLLAVWSANDSAFAFAAAQSLAKTLLEKSQEGSNRGFPTRSVHIGISQGACVAQIQQGEFKSILGDAVNAALNLMRQARLLGVPILMDRAMADQCTEHDVEELVPGMFSIRES